MIIKTMRHPTGFRWGNDPFTELDRRLREFQSAFESLSSGRGRSPGVFPPVNIEEDADNYFVSAELPGMSPEDITIETLDRTLTVAGARKIEDEGENVSYHRREREAGTFRRSYEFASALDSDKVTASYKNGILSITLGKAEEAKPRQITVQSA